MRGWGRRCWIAVLSLGILLWLAACGPEPAPAGLDGTSWELVSLSGQDLAPGTTITLVFDGSSFHGYGGCNAYGRLAAPEAGQGGRYAIAEDGSLAIPEVAVTEKDCPAPEGAIEQEAAYVESLGSAAAFRLRGNRLEILDASGRVILVFAR